MRASVLLIALCASGSFASPFHHKRQTASTTTSPVAASSSSTRSSSSSASTRTSSSSSTRSTSSSSSTRSTSSTSSSTSSSTRTTSSTRSTTSTSTTASTCINSATYIPTATPRTNNKYLVNCNSDYQGGDLSTVYAPNFETCVETCDKTAQCLEVSYWIATGYCYLKNVTVPRVSASGIQAAARILATTSSTSMTTTTSSPTTTRTSTLSSISTTSTTRTTSTLTTTSTTSSRTTTSSTTSSTRSSTTSSSSTPSSTTSTTSSRTTTSSTTSTSPTTTTTTPSSSSSTSSSTTTSPRTTSSTTTSSGTTSSSTTTTSSTTSSTTTPPSSTTTSSSTTASTTSSTASSSSTTSSSTTSSSATSSSTTSSSTTLSSTTPSSTTPSSTTSSTLTSSPTTSSTTTASLSSPTTTSTPSSSTASSTSTLSTTVTSTLSSTASSTTTLTTISTTAANSSTTTGTSTSTISTTTTTTPLPTFTPGVLPAVKDWKALNGTAWNVTYVGDLAFTGGLAGLGGDKCRTGVVGGKVIWNCGDMQCKGDYTICGFSMGPAFYGGSSVMTVDTGNATSVTNNIFMPPWANDTKFPSAYTAWGMDMSNVASINDTHGVVYAWEIWRNPNGSYQDRGLAVADVTLTTPLPTATRLGPLLADPTALQLGMFAILRDGDYIYHYSLPNPIGIITVTRVPATSAVFDPTQYTAMTTGGTWVSGIPTQADAKAGKYSMSVVGGGDFGCAVYGSVYYNKYLKKYILLCNSWMHFTNFYAADTPYGPWTGAYSLLDGVFGYGSMAHPEYSTDGGRTIPWSQGPDGAFNMYTISIA